VQHTKRVFSHHLNTRHRLISLAVASACAGLVAPAHAQDTGAANGIAAPTDQTGSTPAQGVATNTVVVTGIRASMQSTLNLKKNSDGIVDGIVAEDIGKFPDTNLAESLQRITGVSIDRQNGEGQKITVRGMGPDFNLVLLNGRQMPTADLNDANGRSFSFDNLASDAISQLQVYKTSRAQDPSGGIGATVNIMTARPFDQKGTVASVGVKGVVDQSSQNLPDLLKGKRVTPEVSGIFSTVSKDGMWGFGGNASYSKRDSGLNRAQIANGWIGPYKGSDVIDGSTLPQPGAPVGSVTNRPGPNDLYERPQNFGYQVNGLERERVNGQAVLQFRPVKELTATLDYTFAQNKLHTRRAEMSVWFAQTPTSTSTWPGGSNQAPLSYSEVYNSPQDISVISADFATKNTLNSVGFNTVWKPQSGLRFTLDAHSSSAESKADSPWGSSNQLSNASFSRGRTSIDFTHELPILGIDGANVAAEPIQATGSQFTNTYVKSTVKQLQLSGEWRVADASNLNFGVGYTDVKNRSTSSLVQNNGWSGLTSKNDYPASLFQKSDTASYFDQFGGAGAAGMFRDFYTADFGALRAATAAAATKPGYVSNDGLKTQASFLPNFATTDSDQRLEEKTTTAYVALSQDWDLAIPVHTSVGLHFEKTKVTSVAQVLPATGVTWISQNELPLTFAGTAYSTTHGSYSNVLPNVNADFDVTSNFKVRAGAGVTISRARYNELQGGLNIGTGSDYYLGGTAATGNPSLKPVKSKNLDLSFEWYFTQHSVASLGLFNKKLTDYTAQSQVLENQYGIHTPIGGAYYNAALNTGHCTVADTNCIRNYILNNYNGQPGVTKTGVNSVGNATGVITGIPSDPLMQFRTSSYVNSQPASLHGAELAVQHMFGETGFGVQANYTYVTSPLKYKNDQTTDQFAILGLSNSANLVGIYENFGWTIRLAYNWRDSFLASKTDGGGHLDPVYTKAYGQTDLSVGYAVTKNLNVLFEGINLTNSTQRQYGRTQAHFLNATQTGPRYMVGARYTF